MSSAPPERPEGEDDRVPSWLKEKSIARKLAGSAPTLPEDIQAKVKLLSQATGKSESDVMVDLIRVGLAQTDEDLKNQLLRIRVLNTLTLDEAALVMKKITDVYSTWTMTPKPVVTQPQQSNPTPAPQQQEKDEMSIMLERVEREALKGLPNVPYPASPNPSGGQAMNREDFTTVLLFNLGKFALGKLLENQYVGQAIGRLIQEHGKDAFEEIWRFIKKLEGGGLSE